MANYTFLMIYTFWSQSIFLTGASLPDDAVGDEAESVAVMLLLVCCS